MLQCIGLFRAKVVPVWVPIALLFTVITFLVPGSGALGLVTSLPMTAGAIVWPTSRGEKTWRAGRAGAMTTPGTGYALNAGAALEHLDMGGGSVLSLKVTGQQSHDLVTIVEERCWRTDLPCTSMTVRTK